MSEWSFKTICVSCVKNLELNGCMVVEQDVFNSYYPVYWYTPKQTCCWQVIIIHNILIKIAPFWMNLWCHMIFVLCDIINEIEHFECGWINSLLYWTNDFLYFFIFFTFSYAFKLYDSLFFSHLILVSK